MAEVTWYDERWRETNSTGSLMLTARRSHTEILLEDHDFRLLKEWEDLYRNSPQATPFQSWAWLYSW